MPEPNRPRRPRPDPEPDPGFEVVDDAPPAPARKPVRPEPARNDPARRPRPRPRPAPEPEFEVVDETEQAPAATDATTPSRRPVRDGDDDDEPRRKKKPKGKVGRAKTADEEAEDYHARRLREFEYTWPAVLLVVGMGMSFTGALGVSGVGGFVTIGVMVVAMFVTIPLTILTLMVVGMLVGINYGRLGPAVLKIAAITFVVNGVYFLGAWAKLPVFVVGPIGCAVAFSLFKTQFDLDNRETNTSMGALNVLSFAAKVVILAILVGIADRGPPRGSDRDPDDDPAPANTQPGQRGQNQPPPVVDPDDD